MTSCRICTTREAVTHAPISRRPCCQRCFDKIDLVVRSIERHRVGPSLSVVGVFGRDGEPTPKRIHKHRHLTGPRSTMPEEDDGWVGE